MTIWGARWDLKSSFSSKLKKWVKNSYVFSGYDLNSERIHSYLEFIQQKNVKLLISYPSILEFISVEISRNTKSFPPFKNLIIQTAGEKLYKEQRLNIEKVFGSEIFDFYGARDVPFIAHECEKHRGLHISSENVLLEVIDENGNSVVGKEGELVITDLHNFVMPLIRYKIGDTGIISKRKCDCGRTLPMLEEVSGRTFDIIKFPNGNSVGGTFWPLLLKSKEGITQFQIIQKTLNHIIINYIANDDFQESILEHFKERIKDFGGRELKIDFVSVDNIKITAAGKFKYVVSEIK